jgi:hypothetical protein
MYFIMIIIQQLRNKNLILNYFKYEDHLTVSYIIKKISSSRSSI